jgi:hypothetical protein
MWIRCFLIGLVSLVLSFLLYRLSSHLSTGRLYICLTGLAFLGLGLTSFERGVNYLLGERGENDVAQSLGTVLDDRYTLIRNLVLPDEKTDIDGVLVGPFGILVLEVKNFNSRDIHKCEGNRWFYRKPGQRYRAMEKNPTKQAQINRDRLWRHLVKHDLRGIPANALVVISNPRAKVLFEKPDVFILNPQKLSDYFRSLENRVVLSAETVEQIVALLQ